MSSIQYKKVAISKRKKYESTFSVPANGRLDTLQPLRLVLETG